MLTHSIANAFLYRRHFVFANLADSVTKYRKLRVTFSAGCAFMCALLIALAIQSYHTADRWYGGICGDQSLVLACQQGRMAAVAFRGPGTPMQWRWEGTNSPVDDDRSLPIGAMHHYPSYAGFAWICRPMFIDGLAVHTLSNSRLEQDTVSNKLVAVGPMVPMWFLVFSTATLAAAPWLRWHFNLRTLLVATTLLALALELVVPATMKERHPINDVGQSTGSGLIGGQPRALLLTPVPEPATWMLFCLGFVAVALRRTSGDDPSMYRRPQRKVVMNRHMFATSFASLAVAAPLEDVR